MPQTGERVDPFRSFNFLIEIEGIAQGSFTECSGLGSTTESIEYRQGGDGNVRKVVGRTTFSDVTLKWGSTPSTELWDWRHRIVDGTIDRQNVSVVIHDMDRSTEVARWNLTAAWPSKWELSGLNAKGNEILIETLVLSHEGVVRA
jgi:phage tail-like protein